MDNRALNVAEALIEHHWRQEILLRRAVGSLALDVTFTLTAPWTALFAPSGAGKTTILRMLAGLDRPDSGRFVCYSSWKPMPEARIVLTDSQAGIHIPPHLRMIRMVAQRPALFPHRTVLGNVLYGSPNSSRVAKSLQREGIERLIQLCRIGALLDKTPAQLSGGERQRVALARTLATGSARLLLLDEPFSGLEGQLRQDLIAGLKTYLQEHAVPVLMVTHDLGDVFAAGAEVLRMAGGRIVAQGPAAEVLAQERAGLLGVLKG